MRGSYFNIILIVGALSLTTVAIGVGIGTALLSKQTSLEKARELLKQFPLIDGHNDLADTYYRLVNNQIYKLDISERLPNTSSQTDIPRLRQGLLGGQFWSSYVGCSSQDKDAVRRFIEQTDVIKRIVTRYNDVFSLVRSADDIDRVFKTGRIASMIGVEGGHAIDSSLAALRNLYETGVRYMTLTHNCNTPWSESCCDKNGTYRPTGGITAFGEIVIKEMNRLGMFADLAHVSAATMRKVLQVSRAPVIFSHSSAYALCNHPRNVPDDVLNKMAKNGGVVMVNFLNGFVCCPPLCNQTGQRATIPMVADHIDYIVKATGSNDHVGIGADYNGGDKFPEGLEDVSGYPYLFAELIDRGWTDENLKKLAGANLIEAFRKMEKVRDRLSKDEVPNDEVIDEPIVASDTCRTHRKTKDDIDTKLYFY
ncbi:dipeptidase 1-like [Tubulanus polymorphus]|uniref:dipeptidase 1-like n=1 Tax=Tubulanus polymorphus TaxID=672921 RepID=UPI003DA4FFDB